MPEMARTLTLVALASFAKQILVHGAHPVVIDAMRFGITVFLVDLFFFNARDWLLDHILRAENWKCESVNSEKVNIGVFNFVQHNNNYKVNIASLDSPPFLLEKHDKWASYQSAD